MRHEVSHHQSPALRTLVVAGGWLAFGLGWAGVFLPGFPTTIFWIVAAIAFLRTNRKMYLRIVSHKRFGPGIRLFVEEGRISRPGKYVSIMAMLFFASVGALAIPPVWVKILVIAAALAGSAWVAVLPLSRPKGAGTGTKLSPGQLKREP